MYLSQGEATERLNHPDNLANVVVEIRHRSGRPAGSVRLTPAARQIVAQAARVLPPIDVARAFGISRRTASNLSRGVVCNNSYGKQKKDPALLESLEKEEKKRSESISEKALDILVATLESVDPSRVKSQTAKVKMAKDLAVIHEKMTGDGNNEGLTKVLIFAPTQKPMEAFDVIDIPAQIVSGGNGR